MTTYYTELTTESRDESEARQAIQYDLRTLLPYDVNYNLESARLEVVVDTDFVYWSVVYTTSRPLTAVELEAACSVEGKRHHN